MSAGSPTPQTVEEDPTLYRRLATSQGRVASFVRHTYRFLRNVSVPAPKVAVKPALWLFLFMRGSYHFILRVCICEPLFKALLQKVWKGITDRLSPPLDQWEGQYYRRRKCLARRENHHQFRIRFANQPTLEVGNNSGIGDAWMFTIGKRISIGANTNLSGGTIVMDSNGHATEPEARWAHRLPDPDDVRPVTIGNGVWIGMRCIIFPGV